MFDRVLLFKIFLLFFGGRRINITHLFEGLYEWHNSTTKTTKTSLVHYMEYNSQQTVVYNSILREGKYVFKRVELRLWFYHHSRIGKMVNKCF